MTITVLKSAPGLPPAPQGDAADVVQVMLARLRSEGEAAARDYAARLDGWTGEIVVSPDQVARASEQVPEDLKAQIRYAHDNIRRFAEAQRASALDFQTELRPGLTHFLVHPAQGGPELDAMTPGDCRNRAKEHEIFRSPALRDYCASIGVKLTGYREIRDRLRAG